MANDILDAKAVGLSRKPTHRCKYCKAEYRIADGKTITIKENAEKKPCPYCWPWL